MQECDKSRVQSSFSISGTWSRTPCLRISLSLILERISGTHPLTSSACHAKVAMKSMQDAETEPQCVGLVGKSVDTARIAYCSLISNARSPA
eukprot:7009155-Pyramimonas_sp.AAC.1